MSDWQADGGDDGGWKADGDGVADTGGFQGDGAAANDYNEGGGDGFGGGGGGGDGGCRNCGQEGHYARDCTEEKRFTGECFNCGEVGHNKADCTNPRVERPFDGTCNICAEQGHRANECPQKKPAFCLNCQKEGEYFHRIISIGVEYANGQATRPRIAPMPAASSGRRGTSPPRKHTPR